MSKHTRSPAAKPDRSVGRERDRIFDAKRHDPYQAAGKYSEPTSCPACHAVYHLGHWTGGKAPSGAHTAQCPACRRIAEDDPAGELRLSGKALASQREEVLRTLRSVAEHEYSEHPMNRVIKIVDDADEIVVTTTDIHLPQRLAEALKRADHGEMIVQYGPDEYKVRVRWHI